jgi:hypothetical protein
MVRRLAASAAPQPPWTGFIKTRKGKTVNETVTFPAGLQVVKDFKFKKKDDATSDAERRKFNSSVRGNFLKGLAKDGATVAQLKAAGLTDTDIAKMKDGLLPSGYQVHHKFPLDDGGTNDASNLVLIQNDPYHIALTGHQNSNCSEIKPGETKTLDWPVPQGVIYPASRT